MRRRFRRPIRGRGRRGIVPMVKRIVRRNIETKHKSWIGSGWSDVGTVSGTLWTLTDISQGTSDSTRVGNSISLQKMQGRVSFRIESGIGTANPQLLRILIVQARAGSLSTSDMPNIDSPVDIDKMYVLEDRMTTLHPVTNNGSTFTVFGGSNVVNLSFDIKRGFKRYIHYNDATADPVNNAIFVWFVAESAYIQYTGYMSTYYKDA